MNPSPLTSLSLNLASTGYLAQFLLTALVSVALVGPSRDRQARPATRYLLAAFLSLSAFALGGFCEHAL